MKFVSKTSTSAAHNSHRSITILALATLGGGKTQDCFYWPREVKGSCNILDDITYFIGLKRTLLKQYINASICTPLFLTF
jgi:hypothetical protein